MSVNKKNAPHLIRSFRWSLAGLVAAFRHETAFRQEIFFFCVLAPSALLFGESGAEQALLLGSLMLVLIVELLNSAVEAVVDRVGEEIHPLSGRATDLASAAVFLSIINVTLVWGAVLLNQHLPF